MAHLQLYFIIPKAIDKQITVHIHCSEDFLSLKMGKTSSIYFTIVPLLFAVFIFFIYQVSVRENDFYWGITGVTIVI